MRPEIRAQVEMESKDILGHYYDSVKYQIDENYYAYKENGMTMEDIVEEEVDCVGLSFEEEDMCTLVEHFTEEFENYNPNLF